MRRGVFCVHKPGFLMQVPTYKFEGARIAT